MSFVYKIVPAELWREATQAGVFTGAPVDLADGFIHFSTVAQVRETAARHFAGHSDLRLARVDVSRLGDALRWEPSRGGQLFPHLYGPLPLQAVVDVLDLPLGTDGRHAFPDLPAEDAAGLEAQGWRTIGGAGLVGVLGPFWTRQDGEERLFGFVAEDRHLNRNRIVHGGAIMAFADEALGLTAYAAQGQQRQATIQLDTHFVAGAGLGEFVEARCRVVRKTRSVLFMNATVTVSERLVATANGVWKIIGA